MVTSPVLEARPRARTPHRLSIWLEGLDRRAPGRQICTGGTGAHPSGQRLYDGDAELWGAGTARAPARPPGRGRRPRPGVREQRGGAKPPARAAAVAVRARRPDAAGREDQLDGSCSRARRWRRRRSPIVMSGGSAAPVGVDPAERARNRGATSATATTDEPAAIPARFAPRAWSSDSRPAPRNARLTATATSMSRDHSRCPGSICRCAIHRGGGLHAMMARNWSDLRRGPEGEQGAEVSSVVPARRSEQQRRVEPKWANAAFSVPRCSAPKEANSFGVLWPDQRGWS